MDRLSHEVYIGGIDKGTEVEIAFGKDVEKGKANEDGIAMIDCKKYIPKFLRKEVTVKIKGKDNLEFIYEVRQTRMVQKRVVEVRKEK